MSPTFEYRPVRLRLANGELHVVTWKSWQQFLEKLELGFADPFSALRGIARVELL